MLYLVAARCRGDRDEETAFFDQACERIFRDFPRTFQQFEIMEQIQPTEPHLLTRGGLRPAPTAYHDLRTSTALAMFLS
jgi:hypothetical protein